MTCMRLKGRTPFSGAARTGVSAPRERERAGLILMEIRLR